MKRNAIYHFLPSLLFMLTMLFNTAIAQKKLVPVKQSELTGIALPSGSKKDSRLLSEIAGKTLLNDEAKKANTTLKSVEILYLPVINGNGFDSDTIVNQLTSLGWSITLAGPDEKYVWLQKDNRYIIGYFSIDKNATNFYLGEADNAPTFATKVNNIATTQTNPVQQTPDTVIQPPVQKDNKNNLPAGNQNGFAFSTTNFDDGWTSTIQQDWVEVTKGNIKVLLHYPKDGTIFPADPDVLTNAAWNILVAPRYKNLNSYKTAYITTYNRPYLGMGYATENASEKNVFIVFFRQGQTGWIEVIAPDKNTFIQQFKFDPETIRWDSESDLMIPLVNLTVYNKFAVAASDLKGKWTSDFTGIQQLYYVYTGEYAGMNMNQSNEEFVFNTDKTYNWKLLVVNGMVGNAKFNQVKSSGNLSVPNNWQIHFSMIENRARTYHAFWSCIKGARVLNLLDADYPGSGIYTKYGLAK